MRALKILVVVMGVMLAVGFVALVVAIVARVSHMKEPPRAAPTAAQPATAAPIDLPSGARIESMAAGTDRLVIDVILPGGERRLLVLDLGSGRTLLTIPLRSAP